MKMSAFIITLNEENKIRNCLESVKWVDEIVVVDMKSDDRTVAISREYTDKVFLIERLGCCEPARQFAADHATGDWLLNIDADEVVTLDLKNELLRLCCEGQYEAIRIPRKNYFWGLNMKFSGCGLFQDRPMRFFKKGTVDFSSKVHGGVKANNETLIYEINKSEAHLLHFSFNSPEQYLAKMDRYSTLEAISLYESGKDYLFKDALKILWNEFYKRYIKKGKGYKDGQWGFIYCVWATVYRLNIYAKYRLMKDYGTIDYVYEVEKKNMLIVKEILQELNGNQ